MSEKEVEIPQVGMGATECYVTDRFPYTIIKVDPKGKWFEAQEDNATRTDKNGMSDQQTYSYTPNPNGATRIVKKNRQGLWTTNGLKKGQHWAIGIRRKYHDFSF